MLLLALKSRLRWRYLVLNFGFTARSRIKLDDYKIYDLTRVYSLENIVIFLRFNFFLVGERIISANNIINCEYTERKDGPQT